MNLDKIEQDLLKARKKYDRTEQDLICIKKRLYRRSNKLLTLESKRRQLLKTGDRKPETL